MDAQVKNPGKPEVLYNLGNSLIKQKKYSQGVQSLRQSANKGDKAIRENSWYNTGNALFEAGHFKDSAEAFVQSLKLDPSDKDAKHNLELALLKLKEQQQSAANQKPKNSGQLETGQILVREKRSTAAAAVRARRPEEIRRQ